MVWEIIKELFFFIGSIAGLFAFFLPLLNDKLAIDRTKLQTVLALITEDSLLELQQEIDTGRISNQHWSLFYELQRWEHTGSDRLRFSGPLAKYIRNEVANILTAFRKLMKLLDHPSWQTVSIKDKDFYKQLDKDDYISREPEGSTYAPHLKECSDCVEIIKVHYNRLKIISEMHAQELPIARFLLARRFKNID